MNDKKDKNNKNVIKNPNTVPYYPVDEKTEIRKEKVFNNKDIKLKDLSKAFLEEV